MEWDEFSKKVRSAGYDGVEVFPLEHPEDKMKMLQSFEANGLEFSLLHTVLHDGSDFEKYLYDLERNLYELTTYRTRDLTPKFITSQTGREYYSEKQMEQCFQICEKVCEETGISIIQETHRNKWSYAAHVVKRYLEQEKFSFIKLALDISHWICVSESYLYDQQEALEMAIRHTTHLHARVGHLEGSQVTHPRAPENFEALSRHLELWDKWILHLIQSKVKWATITPEFGPYPYMPMQIGTKLPLADQWEINCWMMELLKERFRKHTLSHHF